MAQSNNWDVIVIGGGAAGLMAAASAASRGKNVLLLEKNKKLGVKILMSGGTRCNITHACDIRGIIDGFGRNGKFLHSALAALPPTEVVKLMEAQGVATKTESTGKIFPVSNKAIDVRDALVRLASESGAEIRSPVTVTDVCKTENGFSVSTLDETLTTSAVIITTGGKSYPGCGTTGDGYAWAINFCHSIVATFPALVPILSNCQWALDLKGITIESVIAQVNQPIDAAPVAPAPTTEQDTSKKKQKKVKPRILSERNASFLFTHWGFSGPSILDVSREVAKHPNRKKLELICDFLPSMKREKLLEHINQRKSVDGKQSAANLLNEFFPKRLAEALLVAAETNLTAKNAELSKKTINKIVETVKATRFPINGTLGFEKAEVTTGGVNLKEVDGKTMQSKLVDGLFFAGEILDLDGRIGGFNFQSAFSTGWLAGQSIE